MVDPGFSLNRFPYGDHTGGQIDTHHLSKAMQAPSFPAEQSRSQYRQVDGPGNAGTTAPLIDSLAETPLYWLVDWYSERSAENVGIYMTVLS
jgi:hypothetical protein